MFGCGRGDAAFCGARLWDDPRAVDTAIQRLDMTFQSDQLPVAPQGDFLYEQKVTKESHRERVFRLPLSL